VAAYDRGGSRANDAIRKNLSVSRRRRSGRCPSSAVWS
jgi:hypothetical protein